MDYRNIQEPNVISADTGLNGSTPIVLSQVIPNPHSRLNIGPRFDYQLSKSNTLSVRYQYYRNAQTNNGSGALVLESAGYNTLNTEQTVQISDTQIITPKIINEIHFQFLNDISNQLAVSLAPHHLPNAGVRSIRRGQQTKETSWTAAITTSFTTTLRSPWPG